MDSVKKLIASQIHCYKIFRIHTIRAELQIFVVRLSFHFLSSQRKHWKLSRDGWHATFQFNCVHMHGRPPTAGPVRSEVQWLWRDFWACRIIWREKRKQFIVEWEFIRATWGAILFILRVLCILNYRSAPFLDHAQKGLQASLFLF